METVINFIDECCRSEAKTFFHKELLGTIFLGNSIGINYDNGYFVALAAMNDNLKMLELLYDYGASVELDDYKALKLAGQYNNVRCITYLLKVIRNIDMDKIMYSCGYDNIVRVSNEISRV